MTQLQYQFLTTPFKRNTNATRDENSFKISGGSDQPIVELIAYAYPIGEWYSILKEDWGAFYALVTANELELLQDKFKACKVSRMGETPSIINDNVDVRFTKPPTPTSEFITKLDSMMLNFNK